MLPRTYLLCRIPVRPNHQRPRRVQPQRLRYRNLPVTKLSRHPITPLSITRRRRHREELARVARAVEHCHRDHPSRPIEPEALEVLAPLVLETTRDKSY